MAERGMLLEASGRKDDHDEDFDAFNDDTFGGVSEEWAEDAHEELAQMTEEERLALQQSQDFFGFDGGDEGEELEPLEESNGDLAHALEDRLRLRPALPDDPAILNVLPVMPPPPPAHFMLPSHRGAAAAASAEPPSDPAIMSVGKLPSTMPLHHMSHMHQMQGMQHVPQMAIPMHLMPPAPPGMPPPPPPNFLPAAMRSMPPPPMHHQIHMNHQPPPREHRSMHDLEQEMMRQQPRFTHQQQQQQRQHHQYHDGRQQQSYGGAQHQSHHRDQYQQRNRFDDKNRETFGEDFVSDNSPRGGFHSDNGTRGYHHPDHSSRGFHQRDHPPRGNFQSSQRVLMPGHVHALGILRDARERLHQSTGNPQLDLEIERREEHDQDWQREYYNRSMDDEYAGLMTPRERQWIINIQLQQLKCENPFLDDYYYTVYNQKKAAAAEEEPEADEQGRQLKRTEEGPQLLLQECGGDGGRDEYRPVQFSNSLGKLQAVTVKAPRRIIDVPVAKEDGGEAGGPSSAQKESRRYKSTLMEIERMYGLLIEAEDCEKKIAALPTNTAMRKQVQQERELAVQRLCATLAAENRIKRYLMVRKGKTLLKRSLRMLDDASLQLFCTNLFQLFPVIVRRDKDDRLLISFWADLKKHLRMASFELLQLYMRLLNAGSTSPSPSPKLSYSTFKQALANPLGTSVVLVMLNQLGRIQSSLSPEETRDAKNTLRDLMQAVADSADVAKPIEAVNVQAIEGLMQKDDFQKLERLGSTGQ